MIRLSQKTIATLNALKRPKPASQQHDPADVLPFDLLLTKVRTPIMPGNLTGDVAGRRGELEVVTQSDDAADDPWDHSDNQFAITAVSGSQVTVTGDLSSELVAGSLVGIVGSTGNDAMYELASVPSFASGSSVLTFARNLPDLTADGNVIIPAPWGLRDTSEILTASAQSAACGFLGDHIVCARIGREVIPLTGPQKVFGYLQDSLDAPTIATGPPKRLTPATADALVYHFDSDGDWASTGIIVEVNNVSESVSNIAANTLVSFVRYSGRWLLDTVDCDPSELF